MEAGGGHLGGKRAERAEEKRVQETRPQSTVEMGAQGRGGEGQGPGALPSFMGGLGGLVQAPQSRKAFLKALLAQGVVQAGGAKFL